MSPQQRHPFRASAAGALLGLVALVLVAAILGGALSAIRANTTVDSLAAQLTQARQQIDALRDDNTRLADQNRQILRQNRALATALRRHGLAVPPAALTPTLPTPRTPVPVPKVPTGPGPSPSKQPHPSPRPSPSTPPAPTPTGTLTPPVPGLEGLCDLTPILCHP